MTWPLLLLILQNIIKIYTTLDIEMLLFPNSEQS